MKSIRLNNSFKVTINNTFVYFLLIFLNTFTHFRCNIIARYNKKKTTKKYKFVLAIKQC